MTTMRSMPRWRSPATHAQSVPMAQYVRAKLAAGAAGQRPAHRLGRSGRRNRRRHRAGGGMFGGDSVIAGDDMARAIRQATARQGHQGDHSARGFARRLGDGVGSDSRCGEEGAGRRQAGGRQHGRASRPRAAITSATSADKIVAEPGTITGSIGVFTGKVAIGKSLGDDRRRHRPGRRRQERADEFRHHALHAGAMGRGERPGRRDLCGLHQEGGGRAQTAARQGAGHRARPRVVGRGRQCARPGRPARRLLDGGRSGQEAGGHRRVANAWCSSVIRATRASSRRWASSSAARRTRCAPIENFTTLMNAPFVREAVTAVKVCAARGRGTAGPPTCRNNADQDPDHSRNRFWRTTSSRTRLCQSILRPSSAAISFNS